MSWRKLLPRGVGDLVWQILLFCGAYWVYRLVRGQVFDQSAAAFEHARQIVDAERALHLFIEPSLQNWAIQSRWIDDVGSWMYINTHFVVTTCTLAFIYLFRNEHFYWVRNMFMVAMALALAGYVLYPTAPPRMLPELGFVDSVSDFTGVSSDASVNALFNPYAAVPSMHVGFALMLAVPMIRMARRRWVKALWVVYAPGGDAGRGRHRQPLGARRGRRRGRRRGLRAGRADRVRAGAPAGLGVGARGRGPSGTGASGIGSSPDGHPSS